MLAQVPNNELALASNSDNSMFEITESIQMDDTRNIEITSNDIEESIVLDIKEGEFKALHYQVYDVTGKLVQKSNLSGKNNKINLTYLKSDTYLVWLIDQENIITSFKVKKK